MAAQQACGCRCVPAVQVLLAERLDSCLAEGVRHVETVRHLVHPRSIAGTSARIELRVQSVGTEAHESLAGGIQPVCEGGTGQVLKTHERRLEVMRSGIVTVEEIEVRGNRARKTQRVAAPSEGIPTEPRTKDREPLGERVPPTIRWRLRPKQLDEPVALHGPIRRLESQVDQQRQMLPRTKPFSPIAVDDQFWGAEQANVGYGGPGHQCTTISSETINIISTPCHYCT
jgi:hypothetical protein